MKRGFLAKDLQKDVEFIVNLPGKKRTAPQKVPFHLTNDSLTYNVWHRSPPCVLHRAARRLPLDKNFSAHFLLYSPRLATSFTLLSLVHLRLSCLFPASILIYFLPLPSVPHLFSMFISLPSVLFYSILFFS